MTAALEMTGVSKDFDGTRALDEARFELAYGEVHALLGENGAGKSSLMNVACGLYAPERGRIAVDGRAVDITGPAHARSLGIGMVHQHFKLVRPFTVAENVLLANPSAKTWNRGIAHVAAEISRYGDELGFPLDPGARIDEISVAEQQRVEIIKVLIGGGRILILDEPTAVLTDQESDRLLKLVREIAANGSAVVLITHKLREVQAFADRVTIMRGGRSVASGDPGAMSKERMTELMVGSTPRDDDARQTEAGVVRLAIEGLQPDRGDREAAPGGISLSVRGGEIYGIAGVGGNGQTELAEALMGVRPCSAGRIAVDGEEITLLNPRRRRRAGLGSVPADRYVFGLAADLSVSENYALSGLEAGRYGGWWVSRAAMDQATAAAIEEFEIQGANPDTRARLLSGGNAQKLVLSRELSGGAAIMIAHSPTRGLDIRACAAVHNHLRRMRDGGGAVLLITEDLDEVLDLSDRIGVLNRGQIVGEFDRPVDRQSVGRLMVDHA